MKYRYRFWYNGQEHDKVFDTLYEAMLRLFQDRDKYHVE